MPLDADRERLIRRLPKVELHLRVEGTLEPEILFSLARTHGVALPYASVEDARRAYDFRDLQSFLDLYYAGCHVLRDRQDFAALATAYFTRAHADHVVHAELFFDPQTHTARGVPMEVVVGGLRDGMSDAFRRYGITSALILCFLRHLSEDSAFQTLEADAAKDALVARIRAAATCRSSRLEWAGRRSSRRRRRRCQREA